MSRQRWAARSPRGWRASPARAITLEPDLAPAHYRLAQAYLRTGQKELAAKELEIFERLNERKK